MKLLVHRHLTTSVLPLAVAAVGIALWLWHTPPVGDLAAQSAWAQLVERSGYVPWFTRWYGGVPVGGYSLVTPGFMAVVGVRLAAALAAAATTVIGTVLLQRARHPLLGAIAFALAAIADLYSGRVTFAIGGAIALGAVLALAHRRTKTTVALAVLTTITSPIAGIFLVIPYVVWFLTDPSRRRAATASSVAIVVVVVLLDYFFPVGGRQPFAFFVFRPAFEIPVVAALLPVGRRVRLGLVLAAFGIALSYYATGPMGSNATRLSILVAIPVFAAACKLPAVWVLAVAVVLGIWPWHQLHDELVAARLPSAQNAYTVGLRDRLAADPLIRTQRVEVLDTPSHTAMTTLAASGVTLARGWVRQVDEGRNALFYGRSPLTATSYRIWLDEHAVGYVAVPKGTPFDFGSGAEAALVAGGLDYLRPVWSDSSWTLYEVDAPAPMATGSARVVDLTDTGVVLQADAAGTAVVKLRWSRWLKVDGARVRRGSTDDTVRIELTAPGTYRIHGAWG